jgi:hypothetical protein
MKVPQIGRAERRHCSRRSRASEWPIYKRAARRALRRAGKRLRDDAPRRHVFTGWLLAAALLVLPGCPHRPVDPPRPAPVVAGCRLMDPPPARPVAKPEACAGFEACFSLAAAAELDRYLGDVDAWAQSVWLRCGVEPADGEARLR